MKFGCCLSARAEGGRALNIIAKLGYSCVELPLFELAGYSNDELAQVKAQMEELSLVCVSCNCFFPRGGYKLTGADFDLKGALAYTRGALTKAAMLGVRYVGVGCGAARNCPPDFSPEQNWEQLVTFFRGAAPLAGDLGIKLSIEPLCRLECNVLNTVEEAWKMVCQADCGIGINPDYYHMVQEKEPVECLAKYKDAIASIHVSNPYTRVVPGQNAYPSLEDDVDYSGFFQTLRNMNYKGNVCCEGDYGDLQTSAAAALRLLRSGLEQPV